MIALRIFKHRFPFEDVDCNSVGNSQIRLNLGHVVFFVCSHEPRNLMSLRLALSRI